MIDQIPVKCPACGKEQATSFIRSGDDPGFFARDTWPVYCVACTKMFIHLPKSGYARMATEEELKGFRK